MLIGYARVSTTDQKLVSQVDALEQSGCETVFVEKASGAARDRPQLKAALEYARRGDVLVVWKLDRLARSLSLILDTLKDLDARGIEIRYLQQQIDTSTSWGKAFFQIRSGAQPEPRADDGGFSRGTRAGPRWRSTEEDGRSPSYCCEGAAEAWR